MERQRDGALGDLPLFAGLSAQTLTLLSGCASDVCFHEDEEILRRGDPAEVFYVLRHGRVALQTYSPARGPVTIETIAAGDVLGWSWMFPPYRWHLDARALTPVRATAFDAPSLRHSCQDDPTLGYALMSRFAQVVIERLQWTRLRLLDVYGDQ